MVNFYKSVQQALLIIYYAKWQITTKWYDSEVFAANTHLADV